MKTIVADAGLVAYCGLYCSACRGYLKGKCPGCHDNAKATWCKVKSCCTENGYASCADCNTNPDPAACNKFNSVLSKVIGIILRSDRRACILQIKSAGIARHAEIMSANRRQSIRPA